jgi:putative transposase
LPQAGDKWHLDEVVLKINGVTHWLWRAVDQAGMVLDVLVQSRRDKQAGELRRCEGGDAFNRAPPAQGAEQQGGELPSADPTTRAQMKRFKTAGQAQRFLSAHDGINNLFSFSLRVGSEIRGVAARA